MDVPAGQRTFERESLDPHCLSDEEAGRLLAGAPWTRFLVVGDSIAEGLGEKSPGYRELAWAQRVARALQRQQPDGFDFVNLGRRDLVIAEVRKQQLPAAVEFRPDLALVIAGGNDILRPAFDNGAQVQADFDEIVTTLQATGAEVLTSTMFDHRGHAIAASGAIRRLGERLGNTG